MSESEFRGDAVCSRPSGERGGNEGQWLLLPHRGFAHPT